MSTIAIRELELWTRIGVPDDERATEQRILVSVEITRNTREAANKDDVGKSTDYAIIARSVADLGAQERRTLESLAQDILTHLSSLDGVEDVKVTVEKRSVPGIRAASVTVSHP